MEKEKLPKDLGIVLGTKDEKYWTAVKELEEHEIMRIEMSLKKAKIEVEDIEKGLKLHNAIVKMAKNYILLEQRK